MMMPLPRRRSTVMMPLPHRWLRFHLLCVVPPSLLLQSTMVVMRMMVKMAMMMTMMGVLMTVLERRAIEETMLL